MSKESFWKKLNKPITVLAPMEDVTDLVFRDIVNTIARPDVFFTEFTNCDGLFSAGRSKCIERLNFLPDQHPVVAQLWGAHPETVYKSTQLVKELGFDGVDLNMGCPHKSIVKVGGGACLIKTPALAKELILAVKEGAGELPVSVKTRIGYNQVTTEDWLGFLLGLGIDVLTVHGRTAKQMSNGFANWDEIAKTVKLRDAMKVATLIIGNGDVVDYEDGCKKVKASGVDGFMIGRGIFNNLWAFEKVASDKTHKPTQKELLQLFLRQAEAFLTMWQAQKSQGPLKHFAKTYIREFDGASELRAKIYAAESIDSVVTTLRDFIRETSF